MIFLILSSNEMIFLDHRPLEINQQTTRKIQQNGLPDDDTNDGPAQSKLQHDDQISTSPHNEC